MSTREEMLQRVRTALGGRDPSRTGASAGLPPLGKVMPVIAPAERLDHFETEFRAVGGSPHRAGSPAELRSILAQIVPSRSAVVLSRHRVCFSPEVSEGLDALEYSVTRWPSEGEPTDASGFKRSNFSAAAGITGVDFVLAESGSLILTSRSAGAQIVSLAPPVHIAIYRAEQIVESLEEALARLSEQNALQGRSIVLITGTSRTADIEQISIRGVHGPTQVHAVLI